MWKWVLPVACLVCVASGSCTFPPLDSGCGSTGCFKDATNCTGAPFMYCPNNDPKWAVRNPAWKQCLSEPCYQSEARAGNASCAAQCTALWEASNRCSTDDCSYALAGHTSKLCPIAPISWANSSRGWPDNNNTRTCASAKPQPMCTLFSCAIITAGPTAGCWKPENDDAAPSI